MNINSPKNANALDLPNTLANLNAVSIAQIKFIPGISRVNDNQGLYPKISKNTHFP